MEIAGILTVAAAISRAGVLDVSCRPCKMDWAYVLSHPVKRTTPSIGYPNNTSTKERYDKFRSNIAVGLFEVS